MIGYHVTTSKKLSRYMKSNAILPPVRFWPNIFTAEKWAKKTHRDKILIIECDVHFPLPDHRPARFTDEVIRTWKILD